MKFYTNLRKFCPNLFIRRNYYGFYHNFFYLCLLPRKIKLFLLNSFNPLERNTLQSILNVTEEFCSSIEECDYVLLPPTTIHENPILKHKIEVKLAVKSNKKIIVFDGRDDNAPYSIKKNGLIFRSSGLLAETKENVFGLPTINPDVFLGNYSPKKLSIGFCGYFDKDDTQYKTRADVLSKFLREFSEKCDFIINDSWGNLHNASNFYKNIKNNLYSLCVRGGGNFSFRLGEVLMMGRIPILIDTDCILPFPDLIPYDTNFIRIPIEKIDDMVNIIEKYHESHTEEELIQIQKENRLLWETYYIPSNAFTHIKTIINNYK